MQIYKRLSTVFSTKELSDKYLPVLTCCKKKMFTLFKSLRFFHIGTRKGSHTKTLFVIAFVAYVLTPAHTIKSLQRILKGTVA